MSLRTTILRRLLSSKPAVKPIPPTPPPSHRPHHAVISLAGRDEVGIVKAVTAALEQNSANLEHSKMAILGGEFAMILHLTLPTLTAAEQIQKALEKDLPSFCISQRTTTPPRKAVDEGALWELSFEGPDQPGIVSAVTQALATHGANVHMLETETCSAPFAGYEMFHMASRFAVCGGKVEGIEAALKKVEDRFGASIVLREAEE